jgi:hypothetical protein
MTLITKFASAMTENLPQQRRHTVREGELVTGRSGPMTHSPERATESSVERATESSRRRLRSREDSAKNPRFRVAKIP